MVVGSAMQQGLHLALGKPSFGPLGSNAQTRTAQRAGRALSQAARSVLTGLFADQFSSRAAGAAAGSSAARVAAHTALMTQPSSVGVMSRPTAVMPHRHTGTQINAVPRRPVGAPPSMPGSLQITQHSFERVGATTRAPSMTLGVNVYAPKMAPRPEAWMSKFLGSAPSSAPLLAITPPSIASRSITTRLMP